MPIHSRNRVILVSVLPWRLRLVLYLILEHLNVTLNNLKVTDKRVHRPLIHKISKLALLIDILKLWDISLCHDLLIQDLKFVGVETEELDLVILSSLVLNAHLRLREIRTSALDQPDVLLKCRLRFQSLEVKLVVKFALFCIQLLPQLLEMRADLVLQVLILLKDFPLLGFQLALLNREVVYLLCY